MAVMIQVQRVDPSEVRLTKDIDIILGLQESRSSAHALATWRDQSQERGTPRVQRRTHVSQTDTSQPPIRPERIDIHGVSVAAILVADMDLVGLVTAGVESQLPFDLKARLAGIREGNAT